MKLFIGCSSSNEIDDIYINEANKLTKYLVDNKYSLLLGGINGLMGVFSQAFVKNNLDVTILSVKNYYDDIDSFYKREVYDSVSDRKNAIMYNADIFLFFPGGIGTLDELFNIIEAKRSGMHNKNIIIININNYYDNLIKILDGMRNKKFINDSDMNNYIVKNNIEDTIKYLEEVDINE